MPQNFTANATFNRVELLESASSILSPFQPVPHRSRLLLPFPPHTSPSTTSLARSLSPFVAFSTKAAVNGGRGDGRRRREEEEGQIARRRKETIDPTSRPTDQKARPPTVEGRTEGRTERRPLSFAAAAPAGEAWDGAGRGERQRERERGRI